MKTITTINEGNTNNLVIPAVFGIVAGAATCFFSVIAGFLIIGISVTLFATNTGIQIDLQAKRYKKYTEYFGLKLGKWNCLPEYKSVELRLSVESHTYVSAGYDNSNITHKSISYDLIIENTTGLKYIFHEFLKYKPARETLTVLAENKNIEARDCIAERIRENKAKRCHF